MVNQNQSLAAGDQDLDALPTDIQLRQTITREVMAKVEDRAFAWAMREHLASDGDFEFLISQYQIIRDHLAVGKEDLDFISLKSQYDGMNASELNQSIWEKYLAFCKELVHEAVLDSFHEQQSRLIRPDN